MDDKKRLKLSYERFNPAPDRNVRVCLHLLMLLVRLAFFFALFVAGIVAGMFAMFGENMIQTTAAILIFTVLMMFLAVRSLADLGRRWKLLIRATKGEYIDLP